MLTGLPPYHRQRRRGAPRARDECRGGACLRLWMLRLAAILTCGPMGASYMTLWTPALAGGG